MENTLATILIIAFLLIGAVGGVVLTPEKDCPVVEPEVTYQNVSVDRVIEISAPSQLDLAVAEFLKAVEDEEAEAGNSVNVLKKYDFDEMEVSRIYSDHAIIYDHDNTTVDFKIRLKFDQDDEPSKKKTFDVTVVWEEDEDTEVTVA